MSSSRPIEERDLRDIAALADGTLHGSRRDRVEARVREEPELAALLDEQRAAIAALQALDPRASAELRMRLRESGGRSPAGRGFRRPLLAAGLATAALGGALVLTVPDGTPGGPDVVEAAALGTRPTTQAAPAADASRPGYLRRVMEGIRYPDWGPRFGWRAVGARSDSLNGRRAVTVFYRDSRGRRMAYTIVGGRALERPASGPQIRRGTTVFRPFSLNGRRVVTWERAGHTCVLSAEGLQVARLVDLAAYPVGSRDGARQSGKDY